jgi:hypothetical protein
MIVLEDIVVSLKNKVPYINLEIFIFLILTILSLFFYSTVTLNFITIWGGPIVPRTHACQLVCVKDLIICALFLLYSSSVPLAHTTILQFSLYFLIILWNFLSSNQNNVGSSCYCSHLSVPNVHPRIMMDTFD